MKNFNSLFLQRVADAHLFTWGYLGYHLFSMVCMRLFLNSESIFTHAWFWVGIFVLEHIVIFFFFWLASKIVTNYTVALVLAGTLAIGVIRTCITTSLGIAAGVDAGVAWEYQIFIGALWEMVLAIIWANVNGAYRSYRQIVRELQEAKGTILGYRENAEQILAEEQEKLQSLARDAILPQIQRIEDALAAGGKDPALRLGLANEIRGLINNQVRPLSESLRSSAKALVAPVQEDKNMVLAIVIPPRRFYLQKAIFPALASVTMLLSFLASPFWILDVSWAFPSALMVFFYFGVLYLIKKLLVNAPTLPLWLGTIGLIFTATLAVVPAYTTAVLFYQDLKSAVLYGLTLVTASNMTMLIFAYLNSLDYSAREYTALLEENNLELKLEMTIFERQLWAARRAWSNVIHGTVQASLTAALTRLNSAESDKQTITLIKKDVKRASDALSSSPISGIKFSPALRELVDSWAGICDIEVNIPNDLKRSISKDVKLSSCLNELIKEAVSNAVRHGNARTAQVSLKLADDGVLDLTVTNDGYAPRIGGRKGVGSNLLDELTVDWSLGFNSATDQTILTARLPFLTSQA